MRAKIIFCFFLLPVLCSTESGLSKSIKSQIAKIIETSNPGTHCTEDLKTFTSDLYNYKLWALQMFDANAKLQPGILTGHLFQLGNFDECLAIRHQQDKHIIEGQYCSGILMSTDNSSFLSMLTALGVPGGGNDVSSVMEHLIIIAGICLPKSCSVKHLQRLWDYTEKTNEFRLHAFFEEDLCVYKGKPIESYAIDFYVFSFLGIILVIVICSTIYDIYLRLTDKKNGFLVIFSLYTNGKKLLSTRSENTLSCLYGIKVFSMIWIIFGHIWLANSVSPKINTIQFLLQIKSSFESSIILAATFAVDTFFSVSGILVTYVHMKYSEKHKISWVAFYTHRFMRLSPPIIAVILFYISVIKHLSYGPFWHVMYKKFAGNCYKNWWSTLFFYTNHIPLIDQCVGETWYLSIDTQLYCLAPIFLIFIKKHPRRVITGITIACFIAIVHNFTVTIRKNLAATFLDIDENYYTYFFHSTLSRSPPFLIGILCGFALYHHKNRKMPISKKSNLLLLTISLWLMLFIVLYHITLTENDYNVYRAALHNALARPLWCLAVCYIIFSCSTGRGGFINTFLSNPVFMVLGKLTYTMYLVHLAILIIMGGYQRYVRHLSNLEVFREFWGDYVIIVLCSTIMCLIFETPVLSLMNYLEDRKLEKRMINKKLESEKMIV